MTAPNAAAPPGTPLYVHLPFCAAKCPYCDFYSIAAEGEDVDGMLDALLREADERAPREPSTVFLGGGTPSLLDETQLARLLDRLDSATGFRSSAVEVTAECNPESLDGPKAAALLSLGVRRLSIGFQSLSPTTLELFGRVHSVDQSFRAFEAARAAGCDDLNVDLIYAAPGQTPEDWERELTTVLALGPDHLSAYNLTYEEGTLFRRWLEEGRLAPTPEEAELAMLRTTRGLAAAAGLEAYEVSNHARPGRECRHNLNYWRNGPYVGIGPSAVSKVGHTRRGNPRSLAAWRNRPGEADWEETLEPVARLGETWWLGLRTREGVLPERARASAGHVGPDPAELLAAALAEEGLLELAGGAWRLTAAGLPLADGVGRRFLDLAPASAPPPRSADR